MNVEDTTRCQHAINLANSGQKQLAYQLFCTLSQRNAENVTLLYWIAYTTPERDEAERAISNIARLEPDHPKLQDLHRSIQQKQYAPPTGPTLQCPYCQHVGSVRIVHKTSLAGWICFVVVLILFFPLCWIGFLIKQSSYACKSCGIVLGKVS